MCWECNILGSGEQPKLPRMFSPCWNSVSCSVPAQPSQCTSRWDMKAWLLGASTVVRVGSTQTHLSWALLCPGDWLIMNPSGEHCPLQTWGI